MATDWSSRFFTSPPRTTFRCFTSGFDIHFVYAGLCRAVSLGSGEKPAGTTTAWVHSVPFPLTTSSRSGASVTFAERLCPAPYESPVAEKAGSVGAKAELLCSALTHTCTSIRIPARYRGM